ncbi:MAG: AmmeMemoRadiSam system protein B [Desulfobacter sp.]|nr:MAG: AmmeMemoRadiSam system protein B [Desulfobacter sp.]
MEIKPTAFAGSWYPGSADECEAAIREFSDPAPDPGEHIGGIVPHAGWVYSGAIACRVIASLVSPTAEAPDTIVLFGAHMHPGSQAFILGSGAVDTPVGPIEADQDLAAYMGKLLADTGHDIRSIPPSRFPDDNTLELQYPFIRHFFPDTKLVACGVPPSGLAALMGEAAVDGATSLGRRIRILGSTDMTHYGPNFGFEPAGRGPKAVEWVKEENDAAAIGALIRMDVSGIIEQGLSNHNMCCAGAAAAAVAACKKIGAAKGICLDYASSYDLSRASSFVGYCGMVYPV